MAIRNQAKCSAGRAADAAGSLILHGNIRQKKVIKKFNA